MIICLFEFRAVFATGFEVFFLIAVSVFPGFGAIFFGGVLEVVLDLGLLKSPLLLPKSCPTAMRGKLIKPITSK